VGRNFDLTELQDDLYEKQKNKAKPPEFKRCWFGRFFFKWNNPDT